MTMFKPVAVRVTAGPVVARAVAARANARGAAASRVGCSLETFCNGSLTDRWAGGLGLHGGAPLCLESGGSRTLCAAGSLRWC